MADETPETPAELLLELRETLRHIDVQVHEIRQFITDHQPALDRAMKLLRNPVSDYLAARSRGTRA